MIIDKGRHYLYRHIRQDKNQPFYIGIGTKYENKKFKTIRSEYYRAYSKEHRGPAWRGIVKRNSDYLIEIVLESEDYEYIKEKEKEFIKLYGRIDLETGFLVNLTDGGDGLLGAKHSEETRIKMSLSAIKRGVQEHTPRFVKAGPENAKKPILQYDLGGNLVQEWPSAKDAYTSLNICQNSINCCARGIYEYAGYFVWIYKKENVLNKIETSHKVKNLKLYLDTKERLSKGIYLNKNAINMLDMPNNITKEYPSIKECELATGIKSFYICRLLASNKIYKKQYKFNYQKSLK